MSIKPIYLPGLRGFFGDWTYYSCLMPLKELATRVDFAREVHTSEGLSDMIQRVLSEERTPAIANYLITNEQRFFNSLVIAVYKGEPSWHEFGRITPRRPDISVSDIPEFARHSLGFLKFNGQERLFALDGQHRLAGIKEAIRREAQLGDDEVSTIFVAHRNTKVGLRRTRRLFTTLNKTAKPVSKAAVIALDESDVMAITVRRLVEENAWFLGSRVVYKHTNNLSLKDQGSITTIGNLYDLVEKVLLADAKGPKRGAKREQLRFYRPSDEALERYYEEAVDFFRMMGEAFEELNEFYVTGDPLNTTSKYRNLGGGSILFRPVGLTTMVEVILQLAETRPLHQAFVQASRLPTTLQSSPFAGILWNTHTSGIISKGGPLTRRLLLYMLGEPTDELRLKQDYAKALGAEADDIRLPRRIKSR